MKYMYIVDDLAHLYSWYIISSYNSNDLCMEGARLTICRCYMATIYSWHKFWFVFSVL